VALLPEAITFLVAANAANAELLTKISDLVAVTATATQTLVEVFKSVGGTDDISDILTRQGGILTRQDDILSRQGDILSRHQRHFVATSSTFCRQILEEDYLI
jgi:hypothetical protein